MIALVDVISNHTLTSGFLENIAKNSIMTARKKVLPNPRRTARTLKTIAMLNARQVMIASTSVKMIIRDAKYAQRKGMNA